MKALGVYVHIPFCKSKCHYCDFCSAPADDDIKSNYIKCLAEEITCESSREYLKNHCVDSIFFGGGTPTCLKQDDLCYLLKCLISSYNVSNDAEITIECNPGTVDLIALQTLKNGGFNRISFGLQSVHDNELSALGRIHDLKSFEETYNNARRARFDNVNIDLMYGIPFQTEKSFEKTLQKVVSYAPEHISAYSLKIEPGTQFYRDRDKLILPDEDAEYNMYMTASRYLSEAGYHHYEISNYTVSGKRSRHNLKYWSCEDYAGFGLAAHSCIGSKRYENTDSLKQYLTCFENGSFSQYNYVSVEELPSVSEFAEEHIMMRMRLSDGLSVEEFNKRFDIDFEEKYFQRIIPFINSGHIIYDPLIKRISFTDQGMYVSNYILTEILDL